MTLYTIVRKSRSQPEQVQAYRCVRRRDWYEFWSASHRGASLPTDHLELQVPVDDIVSIDPPVGAPSPERSP
jgi:predicted transcriptional regulator